MSAPARTAASRHWISVLLLLGAMAGALVFALIPASGEADWFPQADKLRHATTFAFLWLLGMRAGAKPLNLALLLLAFGVGIEVAQSFTPDREASVFDVLADSAGIVLGWLFIKPAQAV
jgi:hypothetical protein